MRERKEIEAESKIDKENAYYPSQANNVEKAMLEVLLDIRDLLKHISEEQLQ